MELELLENPRRRGRRRHRNPNIVGYDELGNPITVGETSMYEFNPRRRRRARKNPARAGAIALPGTMREWTQGIDLMDAACAAGGLAASTMIPGMMVKVTDTAMQKVWKLVISLGCAIGAGAIGRAVVSPKAGKAAIIGGIAGTTVTALGMFTGIKIGQPQLMRGRMGRIGETVMVSPALTREGETVNVIMP